MTFIIGDIHGCINTLESLLHEIEKVDRNSQLVFVGDYVDRGMHNSQVVDKMIELQGKGATCLRGNHDDVIDYILRGKSKTDMREFVTSPLSIQKVYVWWMRNGLPQTLESYGVTEHLESTGPYGMAYDGETVLESFKNKVPASHKEFFKNLEIYWENDTHFSCHAFYDPRHELPRNTKFIPESLAIEHLWNRFNSSQMYGEHAWKKTGVFGHTPMIDGPVSQGKIRLIDCGSFFGGMLVAYHCETDSFIQVKANLSDLSEYYIVR